ncbi:hypothetical protein WL16_24450 [Burkholderia ubonensis]|nr:hypothetical protein WK77_15115 [Burkholderia ubonensis]KVZ44776.1 hypothetical protein WL16_24450 [Burkholderia ubonensis]
MEHKGEKYERLIAFAKTLPATPSAVVHPCDTSALSAAVEAARLGLIAPILVGPSARIVSVAEEGGMRPLCASASVVRRHGSAWVIPTDEEWMIASHALDLLGA